MPDADGRRFVLQPDELLVVSGKGVGEFFPPALARSVLGQREEKLAPGAADAVVVEQALDLTGLEASPGQLVTADLGRRPFQRGGDGVSALALAFPDLTQLGGKPASPNRRTP